MKLKCTISKTSLTKQLPVFIVVQLTLKQTQKQSITTSNQANQIYKFRTQLSLNTSRPKFHNNEFIFQLFKHSKLQSFTPQHYVYKIKFGLMLMQCDQFGRVNDQNYQNAKLIANTSMNLSIQRLKQIGMKGQIKYLDMINPKNKQTFAHFQLAISFYEQTSTNSKDLHLLQTNNLNNQNNENEQQNNNQQTQHNNKITFNPLIQWMLYDQNCHDPLREQNCIKALQQQSNLMYSKFHSSKSQQQKLQTLFSELQGDEQQLKEQLDILQKVNNKISEKLNQKESLDGLRLQIDLLKSTREGKGLLLQKLQYFQDRIYKQQQLYEDNISKYEEIKPQIQKKIKQSQIKELKLKAKQEQQFSIKNNQDILKNYDNVLYEYRSNQQVIQSLIKMSRKSANNQYTKQQAELFLSQVKYQIKLENMNVKSNKKSQLQQQEEEKLLKMIEKQMQDVNLVQDDVYGDMNDGYMSSSIRQGEDLVLQIKLDSLNEEIEKIRQKLSRIKNKSNNFNYN